MKANAHIAPYFAKSIEPVFGLNHLGLRGSAEGLFTTLLPGLNGVTERVRYYSFYCWITGKFKDVIPEGQRTSDAYRLFIRKAEMLLALIQVRYNPDMIGIPGITFAKATLSQADEVIDLIKCVFNKDEKRHTDKTYWANPGGILRQYYNASLKDMALLPSLAADSSISVPSEKIDLPDEVISGQELGESFESSVGKANAELFLQCVSQGNVSLSSLDKLKETFIMKDFGELGEERDLLIRVLNQKDFPQEESSERYLRKETIRHFLIYCLKDRTGKVKDAQAFPTVMYNKVLNNELSDDCALGWYAYHLNDEWQYHASIIFSCVLSILSKASEWMSIKELSQNFSEDILRELTDDTNITLGGICALIDSGRIPVPNSKSNSALSAKAFLDILEDYCRNRARTDIVKAYRSSFPEFYNGDVFEFYEELNTQQDMPMKDFIMAYLQEKIIYRHHTVSLMKYCQTGISSNKLLIEDGYAMFLAQTECTHTAPRITSLIEYITDLGLLKDMQPTIEATHRYNLNA